MSVLEANELDKLQHEIAEVYARAMPDLCFIQRTQGSVRDPENPEVVTYDTVNKIYDDIPCRYYSSTPRERMVANIPNRLQMLTIEMAPAYSIQPSDSGQIYKKGETAAIDFEVVGILAESNATRLLLIVEVV